jgi:hypothetical protein
MQKSLDFGPESKTGYNYIEINYYDPKVISSDSTRNRRLIIGVKDDSLLVQLNLSNSAVLSLSALSDASSGLLAPESSIHLLLFISYNFVGSLK